MTAAGDPPSPAGPAGASPAPAAATRRRFGVGVVALALLGVAACVAEDRTGGGPAAAATTRSPFAGCAALGSAPPSAAATGAATTASTLPDLELPCFTGGAAMRLNQLHGPAVVNLWASWCGPCRTELPAMQQLADHAAGRLTVLGVNTGDDREAAASFGADHRVTLPTLYDQDKQLVGKLGYASLPVTIFVNEAGRWHVDPLPLDEGTLDSAVQTWTGVTVTP
ncbi:MAG: cytochrome c biosis protein CcmG, thiol:disulfide interchange protein DsbE [Actinoplanes sp.]|nr:cytochrome c biosis protein CcmG, thiol:disulfide interchange protein DsbE [Actinoplanes sp.]